MNAKKRPRRGDAQQFVAGVRADMAVSEGSGTDQAGIDTGRDGKGHRQIGADHLPADALCRRHRQHLGGNVDCVDRPDPPLGKRLGHESGARPDIQHRPRPAPPSAAKAAATASGLRYVMPAAKSRS